MILNQKLLLSDGQAITATAISANVLQFPANTAAPYEAAAIARNLGAGTPIPILMQVIEAFATLTSLTITLETADNAALSTNAVVLATSGAVPVASLVVGFRPNFRFFPEGTVKEFLGLRYTVTGSNATTGKITAAIATEVQSA
jgi:1-aminocyclopropane-1-carboxylate deaminase/D-cysteine desulfhydrase-like pyridoxal-dependent ACC family enzyme